MSTTTTTARPVVTLLDVLKAFEHAVPTDRDKGVIKALASTGATYSDRRTAIRRAHYAGMLVKNLSLMGKIRRKVRIEHTLSQGGENFLHDERTRLNSQAARDSLAEIEAEMADEAGPTAT